jgi:hypothetical protein
VDPKKQYYPAFLNNFRNQPFDAKALEAAYFQARIGGNVRGENELAAYFSEYRIDERHWPFHQRILHDEVLYRLITEGYIHPKIHPVAAIYHDREFYAFVFPFIHTAVLKKMAAAIESENLEAVKLLEQWIEPFGTLFRDSFYRMVEFSAEELLKELEGLKLHRKPLPFDTYSRISPAMMHLLNRLPDRQQALRDRFALQVIDFAVWLRSDMKVYTQPSGLMTRLKLLNVSADIHAQRNILTTQWENEKELAGKEKFSLNHLIWIIPLVLLVAFFAWRQTEMGRSSDAIIEEHQEELAMEQAALNDEQKKIGLRMEGIDLNELIATELWDASTSYTTSGNPPSVTNATHLDNGELVYADWLRVGREVYFTDEPTLDIRNESECDAVVFVRQANGPYMERAYYVRSGRDITVQDDDVHPYSIRVYAGVQWTDSLVTANYDQKLLSAGVPEETKDEFPSTTELRGRFLYPAKSLWDNLQPADAGTVASHYNYDGLPVIILGGTYEKIEFKKEN